jgi:hypothetical protein
VPLGGTTGAYNIGLDLSSCAGQLGVPGPAGPQARALRERPGQQERRGQQERPAPLVPQARPEPQEPQERLGPLVLLVLLVA